jgi:hypothetical protein
MHEPEQGCIVMYIILIHLHSKGEVCIHMYTHVYTCMHMYAHVYTCRPPLRIMNSYIIRRLGGDGTTQSYRSSFYAMFYAMCIGWNAGR